MNHHLRRITYLGIPLLISILLNLNHNMAAVTAQGQAASPASQFTDWEEWSAPIPSSQFDITQCSLGEPAQNRIQTGDFNGDGRPDLLCKLVASNGGTTPYVQLAGEDNFSAWEAWRNIAVEPGCEFDIVADFDGNGLDDWLCSIVWQGRYETFYFRSQGNSFSGVGYLIGSVPVADFDLKRCRAFLVEDVNQDGRDDVLCHYLYPDNSSALHRAMDDGEFSHKWDLISPVSAPRSFRLDFCGEIRLGDIDGNGQADQICSYRYATSSATWVQLAQDGAYSRWTLWSEYTENSEIDLDLCHYFHAVDVDGDALTDLLCMYQDGGETGVLVQTDGPTTTDQKYGAWESWFELTTDVLNCRPFDADIPNVIDVNGDGLSDILCAYRNSSSTTTWIQPSTGTAIGDWEAWTSALSFDLDRCAALIASDVNHDAHTDLICTYLYADGSTATFVQKVELYRSFLPTITQ